MRFSGDQQKIVDDIVTKYVQRYDTEMIKRFGMTEVQYAHLEGSKDADAFRLWKRISLQHLATNHLDYLPPLISRDYRHKQVTGQSWDEKLRVKHKCPVCDSVYIFNVVSEDGTPNWFVVGELEPGRARMRRGCCAEALVFVQTLDHLGYVGRLQK